MNEEQRKKLIILKSVNKYYIKKLQWKSNVLLQECLNNLETYQIISDETIIKHIVKITDNTEIKRMSHLDIPMIEKIMTIISFGTMNGFQLSNVKGMILLKIGMMYLL